MRKGAEVYVHDEDGQTCISHAALLAMLSPTGDSPGVRVPDGASQQERAERGGGARSVGEDPKPRRVP